MTVLLTGRIVLAWILGTDQSVLLPVRDPFSNPPASFSAKSGSTIDYTWPPRPSRTQHSPSIDQGPRYQTRAPSPLRSLPVESYLIRQLNHRGQCANPAPIRETHASMTHREHNSARILYFPPTDFHGPSNTPRGRYPDPSGLPPISKFNIPGIANLVRLKTGRDLPPVQPYLLIAVIDQGDR